MILGLAGHVDHGKSALVTALTGRPMDRLAEERRRGITIDLNFAPLELGPGVVAGIIDVPGHEDFVRTMVAGASGIDAAILVVAADEGIMPQTREHLLVLEQLQVPAGVVVLTKADAVEADWLELVQAEVTEWLAGSNVPFGEPMVTSARTGQGVEALRSRLHVLAQASRAREVDDLFRLPVDRVFTVAGTGTVVTGTALSGSVAAGDMVVLLPSGREARVRSIESHGNSLQRSVPGARTAVALSGVKCDDIARGDVLVLASERTEGTTRLDAALMLSNDATALADRSRVRVHHGTAEVMARVRLDAALMPGQTAVVRLTLESPLVARGSDRLVLRSYSPMRVIGGGRIVDVAPGSRRHTPAGLGSSDPAAQLEALVERRRMGLALGQLPMLLGLPPSVCNVLVRNSKTLIPVGELLVLRSMVERLGEQLVGEVRGFHQREPHEAGMSVETLRHSLRVPDALAEAALGGAEQRGRLRVQSGLVSLPAFRAVPRASAEDQRRLLSAVREAGLEAAPLAELAGRLGLSLTGPGLDEAALDGDLVRVEPGRYLAREALDGFSAVVREVGALGEITPGLLRDRTGLSRKFLIPLLEWADRSGITYREGDGRRLRAPRPGAARGA